ATPTMIPFSIMMLAQDGTPTTTPGTTTGTPTGTTGAPGPAPSMFDGLMSMAPPLLLCFGVFYLIVLRPEQRQKKLRLAILADVARLFRTAGLRRVCLEHAPLLFARICEPSDRELGELGEEIAARELVRSGLEILGRRVRTRFGEVDVVAREGRDLVAVEV